MGNLLRRSSSIIFNTIHSHTYRRLTSQLWAAMQMADRVFPIMGENYKNTAFTKSIAKISTVKWRAPHCVSTLFLSHGNPLKVYADNKNVQNVNIKRNPHSSVNINCSLELPNKTINKVRVHGQPENLNKPRCQQRTTLGAIILCAERFFFITLARAESKKAKPVHPSHLSFSQKRNKAATRVDTLSGCEPVCFRFNWFFYCREIIPYRESRHKK